MDASAFQLGGFDFEVLLALAGMFLGLAIAAEVLQEIYKYVTASKARLYRIALRDFLGPWAERFYTGRTGKDGRGEDRPASDLFLRGPYQLLKGRKAARLLPLEKLQLLNLLDRTAPEWIRDAVDALKKERDIQKGEPARPSPILRDLIERSWKGYRDGKSGNKKTFDFLEAWGLTSMPPAPGPDSRDETGDRDNEAGDRAEDAQLEPGVAERVDAARLLEAFYQKFLPERKKVAEDFDQFEVNFEHGYRRRCLRQTLLLAVVLVVGLDLPFDGLYRQARSLSPEEATQLATSLVDLYETSAGEGHAGAGGSAGGGPEGGEEQADATAGDGDEERRDDAGEEGVDGDDGSRAAAGEIKGDPELRELLARLKEPLGKFLEPEELEQRFFSRGISHLAELWVNDRTKIPSFLGNCLVTALLISFGAPFWHRLSEALVGVRRPGAAPPGEQEKT